MLHAASAVCIIVAASLCFAKGHDLTRGLSFQILIELETALLDDEPHWYKLQTHDESSLPLPQPSPFMPRRHTHGESASKKLQSRWTLCSVARSNCVVRSEFHIDVQGIFSIFPVKVIHTI